VEVWYTSNLHVTAENRRGKKKEEEERKKEETTGGKRNGLPIST